MEAKQTIETGTTTAIEENSKDDLSKNNTVECTICNNIATFVGIKKGTYKEKDFYLYNCPHCKFSFINNPWIDFSEIYNEAYYQGKGADPLVDYWYEIQNSMQTIRYYEWRGILKSIQALVPVNEKTNWLDFGCGNGGLVKFVNTHTSCNCIGFEEGWIAQQINDPDIHFISKESLLQFKETFDVITAIEVIEHVPNPLAELQVIRSLLKPGGLFFLTTGNAKPHRGNLLNWRYVTPEIHISFFEPSTLEYAFSQVGLTPTQSRYLKGFADIIRFKCLKNLGVKKRGKIERLLPWKLLAKVINKKLGIMHHPMAWAKSEATANTSNRPAPSLSFASDEPGIDSQS